MKKYILAALAAVLLAFGAHASAFTKSECSEVAENVMYAQAMLNTAPLQFVMVTEQIKEASPEDLDWTKEQKELILFLVGKLTQGGNPDKAAQAAMQVCLQKGTSI